MGVVGKFPGRDRWPLLWLLVVAGLVNFCWLGSNRALTNHEVLLTGSARQMVATGDWVVLRIDKTGTGLEARMVSPDSEFTKGLTKREELEAAIKAHVSDKALYADNALICRKLGKEDQKLVEETRNKVNGK